MRRPALRLIAITALAALLRLALIDRAPPGLFFDEAANGIDALDVLAGHHALFFTGNQGREPLHIYAIAAASALVGPGWFAVRLPSILVGIATVPAVYLLGREFGGARVGLLSACLIALSYWHLSLSRLGFRAVWVPLAVALAVALLLRSYRTGQRRPALLAGVAIGLATYTYIAARLLTPLALLATALTWPGTGRRRRLTNLALALATAGAVALPLAAYFLRHPERFWERIQNATGGGIPLTERIGAALGLFLWRGDELARHNLAGRPVFDPLVGGFFLLGLGLCLAGWRRPGRLLLPVATGVMLLPQVLASGEPHFLRAAGALPPAVVTAALGLDAFLARIGRPWARLVAAAVLGLTGLLTVRDYFLVWAPSPGAYEESEGWGRDAAALLCALGTDAPLGAGSRMYADRPTFYFAGPCQPAAAFDSARALVLPSGGSTLVVPTSYGLEPDVRARLGKPIAEAGRWRDRLGFPAVAVYRPSPEWPSLPRKLPATFGGVLALDAYDYRDVVGPGESQRLMLAWRVLGSAEPGLYQFAHVLGLADGRVWALDDVSAYPSVSWRGGERGLSWFVLPLPTSAPPGAYTISTGLYAAPALRRLPLADAAGRAAGDSLSLGPFKVWDTRLSVPGSARPLARFEGGVLLEAADLPGAAHPGELLPLRLTWWAPGPTARRLTVFAHALDAGGTERASGDGPPARGANPTDLWQPGERIVDERAIALPAGLPSGGYAIEVGLYHAPSGERLRLETAGERLGDAALVGRVAVP